jgi:hypothetical protein
MGKACWKRVGISLAWVLWQQRGPGRSVAGLVLSASSGRSERGFHFCCQWDKSGQRRRGRVGFLCFCPPLPLCVLCLDACVFSAQRDQTRPGLDRLGSPGALGVDGGGVGGTSDEAWHWLLASSRPQRSCWVLPCWQACTGQQQERERRGRRSGQPAGLGERGRGGGGGHRIMLQK